MTDLLDLADQAEEFFTDVWKVICSVLPAGDAEPDITVNEEEQRMVAEFKIPLAFAGPPLEEGTEPEAFSDLFWVVIRYDMCPDHTGRLLAVRSSKYELRVHTAPGIRFEFEREKTSVPTSHIHYSGVGGLLSPALMRNFGSGKDRKRKGDIRDVHLPTGGPRFRPSLEEFLYFVIRECGFRARAGWENRLLRHRESWLDKQLSAAVRDQPRVARETLESLGYVVRPPAGGDSDTRREEKW